MALRFIFGSSGSGKSNYLYEHILEQSREEPKQLFFVVVPEQFSMQTQRELVRRQKNHGIMNIDVVSFQRLAYRVFDELGLKRIKVLEETGKSFVLRAVAEEKRGELKLLQGNMKKPGYINEMKSVISELSQYRILPEQLDVLISDQGQSAPFCYRMKDIQTMYQGFLDYLRGSYITAEEVLEVLGQEAANSALLRGCVLVLDGFTGFTPVQYALLEQLLLCARDVYVTVTLDERENPEVCLGMQELFYMSKKTVLTLGRIARENGIEISEPVRIVHSERSRFCQAPQLEWLERNLFRSRAETMQPQEGADGIFLYSLANPRQELTFLAGEIRRLVREEGYRYQEIAVICGDAEAYGNYVPDIFESFGIPFFLDKKKNISFHPMPELIKAALRVVEQDFAYEDVMACLRCDMSGFARWDVDLLDNYLLANGIRGRKKWEESWVRLAGCACGQDLDRINEMRRELLKQFTPLLSVGAKEAGILERTTGLYEFLRGLRIQEQLAARKEKLEQEGRLALAKEYAQMYRIVMDLLDKLVQLLSGERMDLREYRLVLEAGFEASAVGSIPPGFDQVVIGDIERTRLADIKILFLAGVNDGQIPRQEKQGGLISQQEREIFQHHQMELAPGARERSFIQRFYLYLNLTKPSQKLYLTWCRNGADGRELRRSYLVAAVERLFQGLFPVRLEDPEELVGIVTPNSSRHALVSGLAKAREGEVSPVFLGLLEWYRRQEQWSPKVEQLLEAVFYTYRQGLLGKEVTRELYGQVLENSVTRLERFAACAYAHFLSYGIGLKERQTGEFAPVDMGSLFHQVLERYSVKMESMGRSWTDMDKEEQERLIDDALQEVVEEKGYLLYQDARTAYTVQRMARILKKTVEMIGAQVAKSRFSPEGYEVSFSFAEDLESVNFTLNHEEKMRLRGRIDRMDTCHEGDKVYVKVVDYKSGSNQFQIVSLYHGLQLQLVVYLNAAAEILRRKYPKKEVLPVGMFYYHLDDPVIEVKGETGEEEIRRQVFEKLKLTGVGCDREDESVSKKSGQASPEEMKLFSEFVNVKIKEIGSRIYRGEFAALPYAAKGETGCDYCPYHGICGFDTKLPGFGYRRISEGEEREEILRKMREETGHGDEVYRTTAESH